MAAVAWVAATAVLVIALVLLGIRHRRQGRELARVREKYAHEASSHYRTYNLLLARERQIGRLGEQLRGLEEIATSSAIGAQLYQALITDLRAPVTAGQSDGGTA